MVRSDEDARDLNVEHIAQTSDPVKNAWTETINDTMRMRAEREDRGYETMVIPAGDTTPIAPQDGDTDFYGFSYLAPDNKSEEFTEFYDDGDFTQFAVYQATNSGNMFIVTECIDEDAQRIIFLSGAYQMMDVPELVKAAVNRGQLYSRVRTLDGTVLGTFEHDDVSAFFPDPDEFLAFE